MDASSAPQRSAEAVETGPLTAPAALIDVGKKEPAIAGSIESCLLQNP